MADSTETDETFSIQLVESDKLFDIFLESNSGEIAIIPEPYGDVPLGLKPDGIDFAKWIKSAHPEFRISLPKELPKISLHSSDVWLPLIQLAGNTPLAVFLNMASNYLYDKVKGKLTSDKPKIHMSVIYKNKTDGLTRRFEFSGDGDSLSKVIKKFDLNGFLDG